MTAVTIGARQQPPSPPAASTKTIESDWRELETRALQRLKPEDREAYGAVGTLFPGRGRPRGSGRSGRTATSSPSTVAARVAQHRARQRLLEQMALEAGYRTVEDLAAALVRQPANIPRLRSVRSLPRPELERLARQGGVSGKDLVGLAEDVLRAAYLRWTLPPRGLPDGPPIVSTLGRPPAAFTPIGALAAEVELPAGRRGLLLVNAADVRGDPLPRHREPDFEYLVRLVAPRLGCDLIVRRSEAGGFLLAFPSLSPALACARAMREELEASEIHFRMALHQGHLRSDFGGFPSLDVQACESLLLVAAVDELLLSPEAGQQLMGSAQWGSAIERRGSRLLPVFGAELIPLYGVQGFQRSAPPHIGTSVSGAQQVPFVAAPDVLAEAIKTIRAGNRLVTLFGPGGAGASRAALQVATVVSSAYKGGMEMIDVASIVERSWLSRALADALHIRLGAGDGTAELEAALRDRQVLLVLDSCGHALTECRNLLARLLPGCPGLTVIATATEPLSLPGEVALSVPPQTLPRSGSKEVRLVDVDSSESGRLFLTRLRKVNPEVEVGEADAATIADLCNLVQGLPLAIEWISAFTAATGLRPAQLVQDLKAYLELQTGVPCPALPRERLMQLVISWRLARLGQDSPELRRVCLSVSLFPADFDLAAAAAVCGNHSAADLGEQLEVLLDQKLIEASFPQRAVRRPGDATGSMRYRMDTAFRLECEALRRYDDAIRGEIEATRERFVQYFENLLAENIEKVHGPARSAWIDRLRPEIANFRAALAWSDRPEPTATWARLASAYARFLLEIGRPGDAEAIVERGVARWGTPDAIRLTLLADAGAIAWRRGDVARAESLWSEAESIAGSIGDHRARAKALDQLGMVSLARREWHQVAQRCEASLELARKTGNWVTEGFNLLHLGLALLRQDKVDSARRRLDEALAVWSRPATPDHLRIAEGRLALAELSITSKTELAAAARHLAAALEAYFAHDHRLGVATALSLSAVHATAAGDPERAVRLNASAERILEDIGQRLPVIWQSFVDSWLDNARSLLSQRALEHAERRGRDMNLGEAVEVARTYLGQSV